MSERLMAVPPDYPFPITLTNACVLAMGSDSGGRLPVVLGDSAGGGCAAESVLNHRLMLLTLPDLQLTELVRLSSYYEDWQEAEDLASIPLEFLYVMDILAWNKPAWSPDGRYLAFVAAIDGPTSDLYLYDSQDKTTRRISSGPNQAAEPVWSPAGNGVLHAEMSYFPTSSEPYYYSYEALWWAPLSGNGLTRFVDLTMPDTAWPYFVGWASDQRFLFRYETFDRDLRGSLSVGDIEAGKSIQLLTDVERAAVLTAPAGGFVLAGVNDEDNRDTLYLVDTVTEESRLVDLRPPHEKYALAQQSSFGQFLLAIADQGLFRVFSDGRWEMLHPNSDLSYLWLAPDERTAAAGDNGDVGWLYTFTESGGVEAVHRLAGARMDVFSWHPLSQALLLDCDDQSSQLAYAPGWEARRFSWPCPAWHLLESPRKLSAGLIWLPDGP